MSRKFLKLGAALAVVAVSAWGALALNVDQTRTPVARAQQTQQTSYYRINVNFNDANIGTAQLFGKLLQNTFISNVSCHVITAFNAATTNKLSIGTTNVVNGANEILMSGVANKSVTEATPGYYTVTAAASPATLGVAVTSAADVNLYAKYTQTGTAATTGSATCVIEFIPNNDM